MGENKPLNDNAEVHTLNCSYATWRSSLGGIVSVEFLQKRPTLLCVIHCVFYCELQGPHTEALCVTVGLLTPSQCGITVRNTAPTAVSSPAGGSWVNMLDLGQQASVSTQVGGQRGEAGAGGARIGRAVRRPLPGSARGVKGGSRCGLDPAAGLETRVCLRLSSR